MDIKLQWGWQGSTGSSLTVTYPIAFSATPYNYNICLRTNDSNYGAMNRSHIGGAYSTSTMTKRWAETGWWACIGV